MSFQPTTIGCPGCGERNEAGMAFCIHCGQSMSKLSEAVQMQSPAPAPMQHTGSVMGPAVTCLACGRSDPLNKEFCIYCGAKAATTAVRTATPNTSGVRMQTSINALEQDIRIQTSEPAPKNPSSVIPGILGVIGGLTIGGLLAFPAKAMLEAQVVQGGWHKGALVIYTDKPAHVFIKSADEKTFTTAATASNGTLAIEDLQPGKYDVTITGHDGKSLTEKVSISADRPEVLGYPNRLHL